MMRFKHLYWTRLITIPEEAVDADQIVETVDRKHALGPDVVEECAAVALIEEPAEWKPLFEPNDFNEEHKPLTLEGYKLSEEELEVWGETCTKIRQKIMKRAAKFIEAEQARNEEPRVEQAEESVSVARPKRGLKRSRPTDNDEGRSEADLK